MPCHDYDTTSRVVHVENPINKELKNKLDLVTRLADVTDQNIRSYAVAELNRQVSSMTLTEFQQNQAEIYSNLFKDAVATFKDKGITVQYLGNSEGWHFRDPAIQESINKSFIAQQDNKTAEMEQQAQKTRNTTLVMNAEAQKNAAQELFAAQSAAQFQNELQIKMKMADAQLAMAQHWNGQLPTSILPNDSPLLLSLGTPSSK